MKYKYNKNSGTDQGVPECAEDAERVKTPLRDYIIIFVIGLAVSVFVMWGRGVFSALSAVDAMRCICDGFFVGGVVLAGIAGLSWCGNEGTFDMLFFGVKQVFRAFTVRNLSGNRETFYDYRKARQENKKPVLYILITGGGFLLLGGLFLGLFYLV